MNQLVAPARLHPAHIPWLCFNFKSAISVIIHSHKNQCTHNLDFCKTENCNDSPLRHRIVIVHFHRAEGHVQTLLFFIFIFIFDGNHIFHIEMSFLYHLILLPVNSFLLPLLLYIFVLSFFFPFISNTTTALQTHFIFVYLVCVCVSVVCFFGFC